MKYLKSYKFWFTIYFFSLIGLLSLIKHGNLVYIPWVLGSITLSGIFALLTFKFDKI
jgi:hypothetical protein